MTVGSLGEIIFFVNDRSVRTIREASWKFRAAYGTHKMHNARTKLEFTGLDSQEIDFTVEASAFLGVDPMETIQSLNMLIEAHTVVQFMLGTDVIGSNWVLTEATYKLGRFWKDGTLLQATIQLKIKEYGDDDDAVYG